MFSALIKSFMCLVFRCSGPGIGDCMGSSRYISGYVSPPIVAYFTLFFDYVSVSSADIYFLFISFSSQATTAIVLGVIALLFASFSIFVLTVLYRRGLAIRRKRAMRRYMESGEVSLDFGCYHALMLFFCVNVLYFPAEF